MKLDPKTLVIYVSLDFCELTPIDTDVKRSKSILADCVLLETCTGSNPEHMATLRFALYKSMQDTCTQAITQTTYACWISPCTTYYKHC